MPVYSGGGQYQNVRRRRRRRRRINRKFPLGIMILLIAVIVALVIWSPWSGEEKQEQTLQLPQTIQIQDLILADSVKCKASDFVSGLDGTGITVGFEKEPEAVTGNSTVTLVFSKGDAVCNREAKLYRFHLQQTISVVAENGATVPGIRDFVPDETVDAEFVGLSPDQVSTEQYGDVELKVRCAGRDYTVIYRIEERNAPQGTPVRVTTEAGVLPEPAALVTDIRDQSVVTVTYETEPELKVVGSVDVTLVLTDAFGNTSTVKSVIDVIPAANAPQFEGLTDLYVRVGNTISYKSGVTAVDDKDGAVSFTVDAAQVDLNAEGTYIVYYSATDSDGNTTIIPRRIIVENADRVAVEGFAREALGKIIKDNMTRDQKIFAVYKYTKSSVLYVGSSDKSSILAAAYEGFTKGQGDCYTYYAMNVMMLDLLGLENLEVARVGGTSNHWWNLVLYDDGKWYHVDSCPHAVSVENIFHWKMTESDLAVYTADPTVAGRRPNFYVYDKTLPIYEEIEIAP